MLHSLRVQQRFHKPSPSKFNLIFIFPERPLGGAVSANKQAPDKKKGQTMKVKIRGFVEQLEKVKHNELKHLGKKKKKELFRQKDFFFCFDKGFI